MKRFSKIFISHFAILLVFCQVVVNILGVIESPIYYNYGFYLNTFFGTNILFAVFLVVFTFSYNFCSRSRWCALAELAFAVNYLIVQEDNLYNIWFQILTGTLMLIVTAITIVKVTHLQELLKAAKLGFFLKSYKQTFNCHDAIAKWERELEVEIKNKDNAK
jgi:hypothetical protein